MKKLKIIAFILCFCFACTSNTNRKTAEQQLKSQGYEKIEWTGYSFFSCSDDDTFADGFKAIDRFGKPVSGVVCSGAITKSITIRWN